MTDDIHGGNVQVVEPGSPEDPFTQAASATTAEPSPPPAGEPGVPAVTVATETPVEGELTVPAAATLPVPTAEELAALSPEDQALIAGLYEQARKDLEAEVLPKIQSGYDKRTAALERQIAAMQEASDKREAELQAEIRERMLTGLTPEEQDKLKAQWSAEDARAEIDNYRAEVEAYYKSVFMADCITRFPELELTMEELDQFDTPEEIESAIKDAMIELYRSGQAPAPQTLAEAIAAPAAQQAAAVTTAPAAPAGVNAQTDAGGGGGAPPQVQKFDDRPGKSSMLTNLQDPDQWQTVRVPRR